MLSEERYLDSLQIRWAFRAHYSKRIGVFLVKNNNPPTFGIADECWTKKEKMTIT